MSVGKIQPIRAICDHVDFVLPFMILFVFIDLIVDSNQLGVQRMTLIEQAKLLWESITENLASACGFDMRKNLDELLKRKNMNPNLFQDSKSITLEHDIADHIKWAFNNIYNIPYPGHGLRDGIARYHHGIQHVTRAVVLVPVFANLYRKHGFHDALNLTTDDLKLLQIATLFHDSAREDEGVDKWDHESGIFLYAYLTKTLKVDSTKAKMIAEAMANKDVSPNGYIEIIEDANRGILWQWNRTRSKNAPKNIYQKIIHDVDCLDIIRARKVYNAEYLDFYQDVASKNSEALDEMAQLIVEARNLVVTQGDKFIRTNSVIKKKYEHEDVYRVVSNDISEKSHPIIHKIGKQLFAKEVLNKMLLLDTKPYDKTQILTEANLNAAIREGKVFARAIANPTAMSIKHQNESIAQLELRKTFRTKGIRTQTRKADGHLKYANLARSVSPLGYGNGVFSNVGYLIVGQDDSCIRKIYQIDSDTGFGKKSKLKTEIVDQEQIQKQLAVLRNKLKLGGEAVQIRDEILHYSELLCDIESYQAIFYAEGETPGNYMYLCEPTPFHPKALLLQAIYLRNQYAKVFEQSKQEYIKCFGESDGIALHQKRFGLNKNLPIFKYSNLHSVVEEVTEEQLSQESIKQLWIEICMAFFEKEIANPQGLDVLSMNIEDIKILSMYSVFAPLRFKHHAGMYTSADSGYESDDLKREINKTVIEVQNKFIEQCKQEIPRQFFEYMPGVTDQNTMLTLMMRHPKLKEAFTSGTVSQITINRILLITQFKIDKIMHAERAGYARFYRDSIERFYKKSIDVLLSNQSDEQKNKALRQLANDEFKTKDYMLRVFLDVLMVIGIIFAFPIGLYRMNKGLPFFFSQQQSQRCRDLNKVLDNENNISSLQICV